MNFVSNSVKRRSICIQKHDVVWPQPCHKRPYPRFADRHEVQRCGSDWTGSERIFRHRFIFGKLYLQY